MHAFIADHFDINRIQKLRAETVISLSNYSDFLIHCLFSTSVYEYDTNFIVKLFNLIIQQRITLIQFEETIRYSKARSENFLTENPQTFSIRNSFPPSFQPASNRTPLPGPSFPNIPTPQLTSISSTNSTIAPIYSQAPLLTNYTLNQINTTSTTDTLSDTNTNSDLLFPNNYPNLQLLANLSQQSQPLNLNQTF